MLITKIKSINILILLSSSAVLLLLASLVSVPEVQAQNKLKCISFENNKTSVAGPSPSPKVATILETGGGISNIIELEKLTGNNRTIIFNNTDISNPKLTIAKGLEKS